MENDYEITSETGTLDEDFDYDYINATACIAVYDDLKSAPRVIKIGPAKTDEYIEKIASSTYEQAKLAGGSIPYTAIREVTENFIHAQFREIVVSILDGGQTIRFADQGPGIADKEKAQEPGFTSATEQMKGHIRGVGSGLPIVREYLFDRDGSITIEDNILSGAVVTLSINKGESQVRFERRSETPVQEQAEQAHAGAQVAMPMPPLSERERTVLMLLSDVGMLGVTQISQLSNIPASTTHNTLVKLEEAGLVDKTTGQKRVLSDFGASIAMKLKASESLS